MKRELLISLLLCCLVVGSQAQNFSLLRNDSNAVKSLCYLKVCYDQLMTGVVRMPDLKFDTATVSKSRIFQLKSMGLPEGFFFFRFEASTHGEILLPYIFCYSSSNRQYYRLTGFYENDYQALLDDLGGKKGKLRSQNIQKGKIAVEGFDLLCLLDFYENKKNLGNKSIADVERSGFKCLQYNFQPVSVY